MSVSPSPQEKLEVLLGEAATQANAIGLGQIAERLRELLAGLDRGHEVRIEICGGRVFARNDEVRLSNREKELAVLLALRGRCSADELSATLFPDLDRAGAGNRLKVYVHRLRERLGTSAIRKSPSGYELGPHVTVDLLEIENRLRILRADPTVLQTLLEVYCASLAQLVRGATMYPWNWEWFGPVSARMERQAIELGTALHAFTTVRGLLANAAEIAMQLRAIDYEM